MPSPTCPKQQKRTDECARQVAERRLQGRERNQFMSACMRGEQPKARTERTAACAEQANAKGLQGDERAKFVSACGG